MSYRGVDQVSGALLARERRVTRREAEDPDLACGAEWTWSGRPDQVAKLRRKEGIPRVGFRLGKEVAWAVSVAGRVPRALTSHQCTARGG